MRISEVFRLIALHIKNNRLKVFLTALGVVVGTLTVITVIAIGLGNQANVDQQYKSLNVGSIMIRPGMGRSSSVKLDEKITNDLIESSSYIDTATLSVDTRSTVAYGKNSSDSAGINGVYSVYGDIQNLTLQMGRFISTDDEDSRKKVAVVGPSLAESLYGSVDENFIGESITIGGKRYEVIGILASSGSGGMPGMNSDESVYIPYDIALKNITGRFVSPTAIAVAKDFSSVEPAMEDINAVLVKHFGSQADNFMIRNAGTMVETAKNAARNTTLMLLSIALVVLMVGGIGIMNVMFVSVKERTREIGILKALGCQRKDILLQFLLEATMISLIGSIAGAILSIPALWILTLFSVTVVPSPICYIVGTVFSVLTGVFFGYTPAARASELKPIDALNYE